jgi:hypothetical protein
LTLNWIDKIEYGRVYEIAYGFGGPSENNVVELMCSGRVSRFLFH